MNLVKQVPEHALLTAIGLLKAILDLAPFFQHIPEEQFQFRIGNEISPVAAQVIAQLLRLLANKVINFH